MGQSQCSSTLHTTVISADDFFNKDGDYKFDPKQKKKAHDYCRKKFDNLIEEGVKNSIVIVDNTNSTKSEYRYYLDRSRGAGKITIIVEISCNDEKELKEFHQRGLHSVPIQDMGRMFDDGNPIQGPSYLNLSLSSIEPDQAVI